VQNSAFNDSLRDYIDVCLSSDVFRELSSPSSAGELDDVIAIDERRCQSLYLDTTTSSDRGSVKRKCDNHQFLSGSHLVVCASSKKFKSSEASPSDVLKVNRVQGKQQSDTSQDHVLSNTRGVASSNKQSPWPNSLTIANLFGARQSSSPTQPFAQFNDALYANTKPVRCHDNEIVADVIQANAVDLLSRGSSRTPAAFLSSSCDAHSTTNSYVYCRSPRSDEKNLIFPAIETGLPPPVKLVDFHPYDPRFSVSPKPTSRTTFGVTKNLPSNGSLMTSLDPMTSPPSICFDETRRHDLRLFHGGGVPPTCFDIQMPDKDASLFSGIDIRRHVVSDVMRRSNDSLNTPEILPSYPNSLQEQQRITNKFASHSSSSSSPSSSSSSSSTTAPVTSYTASQSHVDDVMSSSSPRHHVTSTSHSVQCPDRIDLSPDDVIEPKKNKSKKKTICAADDESSSRTGMVGSNRKIIEALSVKIKRNMEQKSMIKRMSSSWNEKADADSTVISPSTSRPEMQISSLSVFDDVTSRPEMQISSLSGFDDVEVTGCRKTYNATQPNRDNLLNSSHSNYSINSSPARQGFEV
jgi:hypothetical protein